MEQGAEDWKQKKVGNYIILNESLGQGSYGKVYKGCFINNQNHHIAVKCLELFKINQSQHQVNQVTNEINNLTKLRSAKNENIIKLVDVARTVNHIYLFFEYCESGTLKSLISQHQEGLEESLALQFLKSIANAYKDLYKNSIIHRDIKPANILISKNRAKLSDFGFSIVVESMENSVETQRLGSPYYMSPQLLLKRHYTSKSDIWSLGITFYMMLYNKRPWYGNDQQSIITNITNHPISADKLPKQPKVSFFSKRLLERMLQFHEEDRISWVELFETLDQSPTNLSLIHI
eukprot:TRINITY_DN9017_c0_g1_i1.p1 TRINITY_DN9017_c0_g1~~TRINITY_DN9017_c0_g1_i1.p1  ORF type:complete len:291 (-),score=20.38 TRINITY_DN9017_c0_g1_i1:174-1046(-)